MKRTNIVSISKQAQTMKTALLALSFLLALAAADAVIDTDGDPVRNDGGPYFILPVLRGRGGGLGLAIVGNDTCPLNVVQTSSELCKGLPAIMSSPLRIAFISTGMLLNIEFKATPACAPTPSMWTIPAESSPETAAPVIVTDIERLIGPFQVQHVFENAYKLVYCPDSGDTCLDLGIQIDENGNRLLVARNGDPLIVVFQKAFGICVERSIV